MAGSEKPVAVLVDSRLDRCGTFVRVQEGTKGGTIIIHGLQGTVDTIVDAPNIDAVYARNVDVAEPKAEPRKETRRKLWQGWRPSS